MHRIARRGLLALPAAAALPRFALAQGDARPAIRVAVQKISNSNTLEPLRETSNVGQRFVPSFAETLIQVDWMGDLSLRPGLARAWRRVDDRSLELELRPEARFHDGTPVDAEAVAWNFGSERMWGRGESATPSSGMFTQNTAGAGGKQPPAEVPAAARRSFPGFERIEVLGRHRLRFVETGADPALEARLTRHGASIHSPAAFAQAESWLDWARKPVGSGPYRIEEFRPDRSLRLVANDEHWAGRPPLRAITFVEVPEVASRINMLLSGEADFACDIPPDQIAAIEGDADFEVLGGLVANHRVIAFDKTHAQLRDPRVRLAMAHAVDRQAIVEGLWGGRSRVPPGMQWDFFGPMLLRDYRTPQHDPEAARRLLREAGYQGAPIPFRVLNNYYTNQVANAQVLLEMWKAVGLNVQIEMKENWSQILEKNAGRAVRDNSNTAFFPDPIGGMEAFGPGGQQWSSGEWTNPEAAEALRALSGTLDLEQRRAAFRRMLEICEREDPAYIVLHQTANFTAKRRALPWRAAPAFMMDFTAANWAG
ncbi:MAG TPA: ABC transporter substrate-binding protein [Roseomonas sp.]|nr:ABC transporter substrate-binding protein [Roseomonas sp.]